MKTRAIYVSIPFTETTPDEMAKERAMVEGIRDLIKVGIEDQQAALTPENRIFNTAGVTCEYMEIES